MIQINCTNCKALLQIDDAFAGGVCRCRYCGTIQTVPKHLKETNGESAPSVAAAVGSAKPAKTLYQKKRSAVLDPGAGSGSGLDDLAGIVASSGLRSGRLQKKAGGAQPPRAKDHTLTIVLASAGGLVVLLLGIIIFLALRDRGPAGEEKPAPPPLTPVVKPDKQTEPVKSVEPNFLGQPLDGQSVVFVVDRGASSQTEGRLDLVKQALLRSVRSLGSGRKFAVVFWYIDGSTPKALPPSGLRPATSQSVLDLQKFLEDEIYTVGRTEMKLAVEHACKTGADTVVLVPMKTFLDEKFESDVMAARGGSKAKIYCVTMEQPDLAPQLVKLANSTHGQYRDVSLAEVRSIASGQ
jgi:hypothetical protein